MYLRTLSHILTGFITATETRHNSYRGKRNAAPRNSRPVPELVVLIVDDDPAIREYAGLVLQQGGFLTVSACSSTEALGLSRTQTTPIDILITDIELGSDDGIQLADELHASMANLSIIVISGNAKHVQRAIRKGYPFLEKPFSPAQLLDAVHRSLLGGKRSRWASDR